MKRASKLAGLLMVALSLGCGPSAEQCRAWKETGKDGVASLNSVGLGVGPASGLVSSRIAESNAGAKNAAACRKLGYW
jgi:hypothetical protein